MRYLIVHDGTQHGRPTRFYLQRPEPGARRGSRGRWPYSSYRREAAEFETREEAQRFINIKTHHPENWRVVTTSENEENRPC
jgi:hypothetical protein